MRKIKRDDEVIVIAGRDKGKRGKVIKIMVDGRALVSGVQLVKKHVRPNPQAGQSGGIIEKEAPIQISNVAIFNPATEKADRVRFEILENNRKIRVFKSNGEALDT
ncbi:MAG: large subunit ribosomal protein L24 [Cellvibrionaceae bacterium]|jgi:large subunit ribosomal protein L24